MPPLTIENAGALVDGGGASASHRKEKDVKAQTASVPEVQFTVARCFYFKGEPLEVGKTYSLPRPFAIEMQNANKGKVKVEEVAAAPTPTPAKEVPPVLSAGDAKVQERLAAQAAKDAKEKPDARK